MDETRLIALAKRHEIGISTKTVGVNCLTLEKLASFVKEMEYKDGYEHGHADATRQATEHPGHEAACKLCGGSGLDAIQFSEILPKSALRGWIEGVINEILMPLAQENNAMGALADGFGQESVALLASIGTVEKAMCSHKRSTWGNGIHVCNDCRKVLG